MKDILIEGLLSKYNKLYGSLTEGYAHFEYVSGGNPYIATTEKEKNRILRKYKGRVTEIKPGFYQIDDDPYMGADDGYDTYTSVDDGYDTYVGVDDGYDTYIGEEDTYEGIDESCNSKSKKELKEDTRSALDLYCDDISNEELNGYGRIPSLTNAQVKILLSIAKVVSNKYKVKSLVSLPYNTRKDLQNWTKAATQSGVDSKVFNDYAKNVMYAYDELNESLKKSKDSEDELYKKIVGYVKKYDSGELDIDETVKQILDFWEKSSKDNLNKDIDNAVKKTAHKKKNESLSLKEDKNKEVDEYISKLLNKIKDSGLQQVIRDAIFRGNVDKKFLLNTICQNMPEQKKEIEKLGLKESFWTGSRWQKRIARYDEFDNGNVFHNDWITVPDEEAEEMARQASIETPNKVFFVQYDDPMAEPSSNRYINGKVYDSSAPECTKFGKFSR